MTLLCRLLRRLTAFELHFAIYRRDRINAEMMHGSDLDLAYLMQRRAAIEREIRVLYAEHNHYDAQLDRLAIQGGGR